ncbi:prolyl oligopeptidase family serine peptidase [Brevundimonas diminuta]|uniref:dienelactone hydrolase family protein n=1 Tax=Brevundimonas diminuta TaxID=293 RepID=UPI002096F4CA|nr:prolyl oligopeptidase family serine peptidase [Brevundimonas diminuta]MCO8019905.1 prolyl oligopeptidase family serine peptidase [Brevundimonas diminuta]MCO8023336.1 prolyl oligopeptidase family serine peptidase [Brevundimonas diminuta]
MDTVAARWAKLEPHIQIVGPDDDRPRPTVLLFHGCGGLRAHLPRYAEAAKAAGWRAVIVDSYAPRGWSRAFTLTAVCTGLALRGYERAGDVLAAIHGISRRSDVDASQLVLAGWSHGGWSIMEMMSETPAPRRMGVADPGVVDLSGVKAVWLAYSYIGAWAFNRMKPWRLHPRVFALTAGRDHLTTVRNAERINAMIRAGGAEVESWVVDGTHAFDEPTNNGPMRHHPELAAEALRRFTAFLKETAPTEATPAA